MIGAGRRPACCEYRLS